MVNAVGNAAFLKRVRYGRFIQRSIAVAKFAYIRDDNRPAFGSTDDRTEKSTIGVDHYRANRQGKFAGLAANLVVTAAAARRQARYTYGLQHLAGPKCIFVSPY